MRRTFLTSVSLSLLALGACRDKAPTAQPDRIADAAPTVAQGTDASVASIVDAAPASSLSDLLHTTRASVAVSSNVDNPRDYPDHLVDGNEGTAWNGRSGDLVGGFVKLQLPADVDVDHLEMSAGFDKIGKDGDLFTMNHRIKRVRVLREGKPLVEHTFDVDVRTPQSIPIHAKGGTYKIQVLETVAGTKKEWRELCVSELRVMGTPGAAALPKAATPVVTVGMLPHEYEKAALDAKTDVEKLFGVVFPSVAAFCRAYDKAMGPALDARLAAGETMVPKDHRCLAKGPVSASFTPTSEILAVTKVIVFAENWTEERFAIETPSGVVVPVGGTIDTSPFNDPGCFGANVIGMGAVAATGKSVEVHFADTWTNDRSYHDEETGKTYESHQDDIKQVVLACTPGGDRTKCTRTELSRVCHVDKDVVDCKSF